MSNEYLITVGPRVDGWGRQVWDWSVHTSEGKHLRTETETNQRVALRAARKFVDKRISDAAHQNQPVMKETYP